MAAGQIAITVELGPKTKVLMIEKTWTIKQLYQFVAANMTLADIDTFNLLTEGTILDVSKRVSDYHVAHLQKVVYVQKTRGGTGVKPLEGFITLTQEPCCVTGDDDPNELRAKMPCGCAIAVETMKLMAESAVRDGKYTFSCPGSGCNSPWQFFLVRHVLSAGMTAEELRTISRQLDANYVRHPLHDIRQCHMCQTYSTRDFSGQWRVANRNRVVCNVCTKKNGGQTIEFCWLCGQQWKNGRASCGNANCGGPAETINALAACDVKTIGSARNVPDTRACPQCGMLINHVDQCKHMECAMCGFEFCFVCLKGQDEDGEWQCGSYDDVCRVAPRQTSLPRQ